MQGEIKRGERDCTMNASLGRIIDTLYVHFLVPDIHSSFLLEGLTFNTIDGTI